jgi:regulatory protein
MRRPKSAADPSDPEAARAAALRLLGFRWRSSEELRGLLTDRGFDPAVVDELIGQLTAEKWLDDDRFAVTYARQRLRRSLGRRRIVRELAEYGIDDGTSRRALDAAASDEPPGDHLRALCRKRVRLLATRKGRAALSDASERNKLIAFLLKQGYDYGDIAEALDGELKLARAAGAAEDTNEE